MTDALVTTDARAIAALSTEDLRAELVRALAITADHVRHLAIIWRELERRGEDLSALRTGIGAYLAPVAYGRLLPEAVVKLAGNRAALRAVSLLAPEEQRHVLDAGYIPVKRSESGPADQVPITALSPGDVARAIDPVRGTVRPVNEQRVIQRHRQVQNKPTKTLLVRLTDVEHTNVQSTARRLGISASQLIYDALKDAGYLK